MRAPAARQSALDLVGAPEGATRPILCLDFDGTLHSYSSGWLGPDKIVDPPVPGFAQFLEAAVQRFLVMVHSSRSGSVEGRSAMRVWLVTELRRHYETLGGSPERAKHAADDLIRQIGFPADKPPAFVSLDDRAVTFAGTWPDLDELATFEPWWKV